MNLEFGQAPTSQDFRSGVLFHYDSFHYDSQPLQGPRTVQPRFDATDGYQTAAPVLGGHVTVQAENRFVATLEQETVGRLPAGFSFSGSPNLWHVADSSQSSMPATVRAAGNGKVLWFGHKDTKDYWPRGAGSVTTPVLDLGTLAQPVLAFSSYFHTELRSDADVKSVRIWTKTPGAPEDQWGVSKAFVLDEPSGGYRHWQTMTIPLQPYAAKQIKVEFNFNTHDDTANTYLGWMIDNIVVGHDHDLDGLPDSSEKGRNEVTIATQPVSVPVPVGQSATSNVRRVSRPFAESMLLESIISTPNPTALTVTLGTPPRPGDLQQHAFVLYDGGIDRSGCTTFSTTGIWGPGRPVVQARGDGLDIRLDLIRCASKLVGIPEDSFRTAREWFLTVSVPDGSPPASIQLLRVMSSGKTDLRQDDTSHDGALDGALEHHDSLGFDGDQDGVPDTIDPDDTRASWAPALHVSSSSYAGRMQASLQDTLNPMVVKFEARFNSSGQTQPLAGTRSGGTTWTVNPSQYSPLPDGIIVQWQDQVGTKGEITYWMGPQAGKSYVPRAVVSKFEDGASGQSVAASASLAAFSDRTNLYYGTETPFSESFSGKLLSGAYMSVVGTPLIAKGSAGFLAGASRLTAATWSQATGWASTTSKVVATRVAEVAENTANGLKIVSQYTRQFDGVTANDLRTLLEQGRIYRDDAGNLIMMKFHNGDTLWSVISESAPGLGMVVYAGTHYARDAIGAWDQIGPGAPGYGKFCGANVRSTTNNPIDELDASCFIHDFCVPNEFPSAWAVPFSRNDGVDLCNEHLITNANSSDCERAVGSPIRTNMPQPSGNNYEDYRLPEGNWTDATTGVVYNPSRIDVQTMTPGPTSPCSANRQVIVELFLFGQTVATPRVLL